MYTAFAILFLVAVLAAAGFAAVLYSRFRRSPASRRRERRGKRRVPLNAPAVARPTDGGGEPRRSHEAADLFGAALKGGTAGATPTADHPHLPKLAAFCRFAFAAAKADGRVARAEKTLIRAFLAGAFGHDPGLARHIDPLMERTEAAIPGEADAVAGVCAVASPAERAELFALAGRVVDASGERNPREREFLERAAAALGVGRAEPAPLRVTAKQAPIDPRGVLDIEPGVEVSADLVRRRYALLTDKLDPTKAAALGPEFAAMAAAKRTAVRAAAEELIARFGVPLDPPAAPQPSDIRHNPDLDDVFGA